jgi:hypothetical protein
MDHWSYPGRVDCIDRQVGVGDREKANLKGFAAFIFFIGDCAITGHGKW